MFESMQSNTNTHDNGNGRDVNHLNYGLTSMNSASQRFNATDKSNPIDKSEINSNQLDINELSGTTNLNFNINGGDKMGCTDNISLSSKNQTNKSDLREKINKAKISLNGGNKDMYLNHDKSQSQFNENKSDLFELSDPSFLGVSKNANNNADDQSLS